jgi:hypothetical protein
MAAVLRCCCRFLNMACPHLLVPFPQFVLATAVGLLPANYIHVSTGLQVDGLREATDAGWQQTAWRIAALFVLASLALLPTLFNVSRQQLTQQPNRTHSPIICSPLPSYLSPACRKAERRRTKQRTRASDGKVEQRSAG